MQYGLFVTGGRNFYLRNDAEEYTHIGIRGLGIASSFTIPALEANDIVEIMWRHDSSGSGSVFTATNVTDLRGKDVDTEFLITESASIGGSKTRFVGYYSFIAKGGDVTFTLQDNGNCDIQSIRIYKGPYRPTMRNIDLKDNTPAPTTMLLDNQEESRRYNYCNPLNSTATGPAMYVLKGYRKQISDSQVLGVEYDHEGCVTGSDASRNFDEEGVAKFVLHTDKDAYPVTDNEKTQLYELRKNLVGLEMYNLPWQSANNSYNDGIIKAKSGWGKVTIRMNNYTNDMKYVIGYTPDYTLTIGSAPHQKYPYTWDFTHISAQAVTGSADNAYNSIKHELYSTNWDIDATNVAKLKTDNEGPLSSQYVPGAVLVTTERALSKYTVDEGVTAVYALDELDGLGVNGQIAILGNLNTTMNCITETTLTIPDLNYGGKQDWIYVSCSAAPTAVTNATLVTSGNDGPDANTSPEIEDANTHVYKYKVTNADNSLLTFAAGTKIYKIGVTHILKDIHQVGNTGWATEIRKEDEHIDHELIGYFTKNDVNAYTVKYDSYDLNTATVALTPINEDGYVPGRTGVVMKLDNAAGLSSANAGKNVPLFYPSYTRPASSTAVNFPTNNLMYQDTNGIDQDNRNYNETYTVGDINYTKFILTNIHWTYQQSHTLNTDESAAYKEADAAGFYRLHIWKTQSDEENAAKNTMPAHNAYLLVPTDQLPVAVWSQQSISSARRNTIGIRTSWGEDTTAIEDVELEGQLSATEDSEGEWYTLSGMQLQSKPAVSGIFIHDRRKVGIGRY